MHQMSLQALCQNCWKETVLLQLYNCSQIFKLAVSCPSTSQLNCDKQHQCANILHQMKKPQLKYQCACCLMTPRLLALATQAHVMRPINWLKCEENAKRGVPINTDEKRDIPQDHAQCVKEIVLGLSLGNREFLLNAMWVNEQVKIITNCTQKFQE